MRAFVFACNSFVEQSTVGLTALSSCFLSLASNYYWPLLEEVAPKLGVYEHRELVQRVWAGWIVSA